MNDAITTKSAETLSKFNEVRVAAAESADVNFSASWLDHLAPLQPPPEFAYTTPGTLQVLEEENVDRVERWSMSLT